MNQLATYAPGIMAFAFAAVVFFSVRHIASNRPIIIAPPEAPVVSEDAQDEFPFDDMKSLEELRSENRRLRAMAEQDH